MTVESVFLLSEVPGVPAGMRVIGCNEKTTILGKKECPPPMVSEMKSILWRNDPEEVGNLVAYLLGPMLRDGWEHAPFAYFLRHHGWVITPVFDMPGHVELTIRSRNGLGRA